MVVTGRLGNLVEGGAIVNLREQRERVGEAKEVGGRGARLKENAKMGRGAKKNN